MFVVHVLHGVSLSLSLWHVLTHFIHANIHHAFIHAFYEQRTLLCYVFFVVVFVLMHKAQLAQTMRALCFTLACIE